MYAVNPTPSIHVIVERGRVTLDGVVNNEADKVIANAVARSFPAFSVTNELKTSGEMQRLMETL
jgi:hyperosmotically inducible protein